MPMEMVLSTLRISARLNPGERMGALKVAVTLPAVVIALVIVVVIAVMGVTMLKVLRDLKEAHLAIWVVMRLLIWSGLKR
jgi:hypothetical protein